MRKPAGFRLSALVIAYGCVLVGLSGPPVLGDPAVGSLPREVADTGLEGVEDSRQVRLPEPEPRAPRPSAAPTAVRFDPSDRFTIRADAIGVDAPPRSLACDDFDGDGAVDLVVGYGASSSGRIAVFRGNIDTVFPHTPAARQRRAANGKPQPFTSATHVLDVAVSPDFLVTGDFDADGYRDVIVAARGGKAIHLLRGDGRGGLEESGTRRMPGSIDALVAGEVNRPDGLADLVVAVDDGTSATVLVFEDPDGIMVADPELLALPARARAAVLGRFAGNPAADLAVATRSEVVLFHGRDRRLTAGPTRRAAVATLVVETIPAYDEILGLSIGGLAESGRACRELLVSTNHDGTLVLVGEHGRRRIEPYPFDAASPGRTDTAALTTRDLARISSSDLVASIADGAPVAVVATRLNPDPLDDLVWLTADGDVVAAFSQIDATILVDSSSDNLTSGDGRCTLREALVNANADADTTSGDCAAGAGNDEIAFDVGGASTSVKITPVSALPPITDTLTINGNTQGCGSPPCVELDGSLTVGATGLRVNVASAVIRGLVIHAFDGSGILLETSGNFVEGNWIGTAANGTTASGNGGQGIYVFDSSDNTIGGTSSAARNVVSGNDANGILLNFAGSTGNVIAGNRIGTDRNGTSDLGNLSGGIVAANDAVGNTIGGSLPGARNIISGNQLSGVSFTLGASSNLVQGNRIGTDRNGTSPIANVQNGILNLDVADNTFGGTADGMGNLISGNIQNGILVLDAQSTGVVVQGNLIGTRVDGLTSLGNFGDGVEINDAPGNTIGGATASAGNVISGNGQGVYINDPLATGNEVLGNFVGTTADGTAALGNLDEGIEISDGARANTVGGATPGAGNVVSGNADAGIAVQLEGTDDNVIAGNFVGTNAAGDAAVSNGTTGIRIVEHVSGTLIGGPEPGAGNVVSGNTAFGITITLDSSTTEVQGNMIGLDATGTQTISNGLSGILVSRSANNFIGGLTDETLNVISGNGENGIFLVEPPATGNQILGNRIGTDVTGTQVLGNGLSGIVLADVSGNTVGSSIAGTGNLIAGAGGNGVWITTIDGAAPSANVVQGNRIGTDVTGTVPAGVAGSGIELAGGAVGNTIGGATQGAGNVVADSGLHGIRVRGAATLNLIHGNRIGTDASGTLALGNSAHGVSFEEDAFRNDLGGLTPGSGNVVAANGEAGVAVSVSSRRNAIQRNAIFGNGGLGIDLNDDGVTPNDFADGDTGGNDLQNHPSLASAAATPTGVTVTGALASQPETSYRVEFFAGGACDVSGFGEGSRYLGLADVSTDPSGIANLDEILPAAVGHGEVVTATATDPGGSTSEFSVCVVASCLERVAFPETILAQDRNALSWSIPTDVRFAKGDLAAVATYATTEDGVLFAASGLDLSADQPAVGAGAYYLVELLGCGSWQTALGAEPSRDALLP